MRNLHTLSVYLCSISLIVMFSQKGYAEAIGGNISSISPSYFTHEQGTKTDIGHKEFFCVQGIDYAFKLPTFTKSNAHSNNWRVNVLGGEIQTEIQSNPNILEKYGSYIYPAILILSIGLAFILAYDNRYGKATWYRFWHEPGASIGSVIRDNKTLKKENLSYHLKEKGAAFDKKPEFIGTFLLAFVALFLVQHLSFQGLVLIPQFVFSSSKSVDKVPGGTLIVDNATSYGLQITLDDNENKLIGHHKYVAFPRKIINTTDIKVTRRKNGQVLFQGRLTVDSPGLNTCVLNVENKNSYYVVDGEYRKLFK